jgi:hypothetical protein
MISYMQFMYCLILKMSASRHQIKVAHYTTPWSKYVLLITNYSASVA